MLTARNSSASNTKIYLYSGHESNIATLLHAFNVYKPHVPEYSSAVILELLENNKQYYVKVSVLSSSIQSISEIIISSKGGNFSLKSKPENVE